MVYALGRKIKRTWDSYQRKPCLSAVGNAAAIYGGMKLAGDVAGSVTGMPSLDVLVDAAAPIAGTAHAHSKLKHVNSIASDLVRTGLNTFAAYDLTRELWQDNVTGVAELAKDATLGAYGIAMLAAETLSEPMHQFMDNNPYGTAALIAGAATLGYRFWKGTQAARNPVMMGGPRRRP